MNLQLWVGWVVFFALPVVLWLIGTVRAYQVGNTSPWLAFITGSDNRLSLSRLQAFVWTLVIFGAFAAAMAVSNQVTADKWVAIPAEVLELAGIAIVSGVFSSLIANVSGEQQQPEVIGLGLPASNRLIIKGNNFGTDQGVVRVNGKTLAVYSWRDVTDQPYSQEITVASPGLKLPWLLVIDTANGKVCYPVTATDPTITLGAPTTCPEWSDLFRDDKSPSTLALMKFQMFGWTLVAVVLYVIFFLINLKASIIQLPTVDQSIVILTGVSQAGYLAGKGVSTAGKQG